MSGPRRQRWRAGIARGWLPGVAAVALSAAAGPALAQNVGNEVWLGQVGGLNVIDITQEGRGNAAGADNVWLLLGQDGVSNTLTLDQYGYDNKVGTLFADEPEYARGVWQRGDLNVISVTQRNTDPAGTNVLGSVQQSSGTNLSPSSGAFNSLRIVQTADGDATGVGAHYVGRIVQQNTGAGDATRNAVYVVQREGGTGAGNILANLRQIGSGNTYGSIQSGTANRIGEVPPPDGSLPIGGIIQEGTQNWAWLVQTGTRNLVEYVQQYGHENAARLRLSGDRNVVTQVFQNSESWGQLATGNRIVLTITGDDNGGSGGWVGELIQLPALGTPGVAQAMFSQIGDENDISLAILSGIENKYGVTQVGDGNDAHISISGDIVGADAFRNETAVFQKGEVNYVSHLVTGSDNAGAVRMEGDRNRIALTQRGAFNTSRITISGDDNNGAASALFGVALDLALSTTAVLLEPGAVIQVATGLSDADRNQIGFDIAGTANATSFYQNGAANLLQGATTGAGNALAVVQLGDGNTSLVSQSGAANALGVLQF
jgi:hypothetical protein